MPEMEIKNENRKMKNVIQKLKEKGHLKRKVLGVR
jgi:hypothetical protein